MNKKTDSLLFKFAAIFTVFTLLALLLGGVNAYVNQRAIYKAQCEKRLVNIARHLEHLVESEGRVFADFHRYFIAHRDAIRVPMDYDGDWKPAWRDFERIFNAKYPGKTLGIDIAFTQMDDEAQMACAVYMHRKWLSIFEASAREFNIHYAYYLVPSEKPLHMFWVIDAVREEKVIDGKKYIDLCTEVLEPLEEHRKMWEAWTSGKPATGYDTYDNQWGKTYAYYTAVYLDGVKAGVIGTEIDIADVDTAILKNTLIQTAGVGVILILGVICLLFAIYRKYIMKLKRMQDCVLAYAQTKDVGIVTDIERNAAGHDEISTLAAQVSSMILELENYMKSLKETTHALGQEKLRADAMVELANKDALTGIRNKTAYDKEVKRLAWSIDDRSAHFGIAVIDLNFLKRINDTFGHEQGNVSIKKLCGIICRLFKHSPVFRIGGDEFAVILENDDLANVNGLVAQFAAVQDEMARDAALEQWERISAAIGIAVFDPLKDDSVENVFKRADKAMYERKKAMKAVREE
ncbi:MAG: GGDEF domain-containing protein [Desulfovibrio sp.]|nr:GGDEF domain-containing protein [Desulfovibrio sp.]